MLSVPTGSDAGGWKVLVYDERGQTILAPLLKVADLRRLGISLHLRLEAARLPVPDVTAVYFMRATSENISRLAQDLSARLYDQVQVHFVGQATPELLEELAQKTVRAGTSSLVQAVYDQHLDFVSLERDLFSLEMPESYRAFNDASVSEQEAERRLEQVVSGLFDVLCTLGAVPVIRCARNSAAEMVGRRLEELLRAQLLAPHSPFAVSDAQLPAQRPLLLLADRNVDLIAMLHHAWTYQALVHDLLGLQQNRVELPRTGDRGGGSVRYELDSSSDEFWAREAAQVFPAIALDIKQELERHQADLARVMPQESASTTGDEQSPLLLGSSNRELRGLLESLPELTERKRRLDLHTELATALLERIQARELDTHFQLEERLALHQSSLDRREVLQLLESGRGSLQDKLRLALIYYLSSAQRADDAQQEIERVLEAAGIPKVELRALLAYVRRTKAFNEGAFGQQGPTPSRSTQALQSLGSSLFSALGHTVKLLFPAPKHLYLTRILDTLIEHKPQQLPGIYDSYLMLDPKLPRGYSAPTRGKATSGSAAAFKEAIVFTIGGGNYFEYQNLQEYARQATGTRRIIYGTTELISPENFLTQLSVLASSGHKP